MLGIGPFHLFLRGNKLTRQPEPTLGQHQQMLLASALFVLVAAALAVVAMVAAVEHWPMAII